VPLQFAVTLFVSAALLFMVQPMIGRLVLPLVGGSPAAWNTCMVFFQALLLAGYAYAHAITSRLNSRRQIAVHAAILGVAILSLGLAAAFGPTQSPLAVLRSLAPQGTEYPMFGMLALLAVAVGLPFFVVSTSAPLLQKWFAMTGHPSARDPYFLYAASNAGSLISLLGYPLFIEPNLTLSGQQWVWAAGFVVLFFMTIACGLKAVNPLPIVDRTNKAEDLSPPPTRPQIIKWIALAFVPSSLMLGVTFHMTTDITSMPLLWVPPLALYLLTFIIAFARLPRWFRPVIGNIAPVGLLLLAFVLCASHEIGANESQQAFLWLGLHVGVFFLVALMCHTELAFERPSAKHLTRYFLWMSFGGMLGGVFNGILAPMIFPSNFEYPIALAVAAFLVPTFGIAAPVDQERSAIRGFLDLFFPLSLLAFCAAMSYAVTTDKVIEKLNWVSTNLNWAIASVGLKSEIKPRVVGAFLAYAVPCMATFFCIDRPVRFGLCVAAILAVGIMRNERGGVLDSHRSFFGILKATEFEESNKRSAIVYRLPGDDPNQLGRVHFEEEYFIRLVHGTTLHGTQAATTWTYPVRDDVPLVGHASPWTAMLAAGTMQSFDMRQEPLTYYHRTGPVGTMFRETYRKFATPHVAMVGLGSGSVACYAQPGLDFTFFEIDPAVLKIVDKPKPSDPAKAAKQFTYLADARARGAKIEIVLGDARLKLEEQTDRKYPLLLVDAFSSDAIPVHLLTKQAVQLYLDRLAPGGLLGLHVSNKFVELEPVVASIAEDLGLVGRVFDDRDEHYSGKTNSSWIVLARTEEDLGDLGLSRIDRGEAPSVAALIGSFGWHTFIVNWRPMNLNAQVPAWTDDYADVLRVMTLKEVQAVRRFFGLPTPLADDD
jgi:hypothetical protein